MLVIVQAPTWISLPSESMELRKTCLPFRSARDYIEKRKTLKDSGHSWVTGAVTTAANHVCDYLKERTTFNRVKSHQSAGNSNYDTTKNARDQSFNCAWEAVDTAKKFQPDLTLLKEALVEIHEFRPEQVDTVLNDFGIEKTEVAKSAAGQSQNDSK